MSPLIHRRFPPFLWTIISRCALIRDKRCNALVLCGGRSMIVSFRRSRVARASFALTLLLLAAGPAMAQQRRGEGRSSTTQQVLDAVAKAPKTEPWKGPTAEVTHEGNIWTIKGKHNTATLDEKTLAL